MGTYKENPLEDFRTWQVTGDKESLARIVDYVMPWIITISMKHRKDYEGEQEDLINIMVLHFIQHILPRYNPDSGVNITSFASMRLNYVAHEAVLEDKLIHVDGSTQRKIRRGEQKGVIPIVHSETIVPEEDRVISSVEDFSHRFIDAAFTSSRLREFLPTLNARERMFVVLRIEGMAQQTIAKHYGINPTRVAQIMKVIRKKYTALYGE